MQTSAVQTNTPSRDHKIRSFVIAWLGITLLMGALAFIGIYYATGTRTSSANGDDVSVDTVSSLDADNSESPAPDAAFDLSAVNATSAPVAETAPVEAASEPAEVAAAPVVADSASAERAAQDGQGGGPASAAAQDATPVPTPTLPPVQDTGFQLGIQVQPNPDPEVYRIWMGEVRDKLKLKWIKQQVRWEDIEPQPGQYDWGALDVTFALTKEYGINVMVSVVTAPEWAREPGAPLDKVGPPADPQKYANFIATMMYRYPGEIHAVEVWNEMNIDREWASPGGLSAANYVKLLQTAYQTIKMVDPGVIVISGALSPTGVNDGVGAYDDFTYMEMLVNAGVLNYADCVGAHHNGYNIGPSVPWNNVPNDPTAVFRGPFDNPHHSWSFYSTLNGYHDRIAAAGSDKKLCITEFGWPVTEDLTGTPQSFEFADDNTLVEQAAYIGEAVQLMQDWGWVWLAWIWNLNYGPQSNWDASNDNVPYSLLRPNWQNAPAYEAVAQYDFRAR